MKILRLFPLCLLAAVILSRGTNTPKLKDISPTNGHHFYQRAKSKTQALKNREFKLDLNIHSTVSLESLGQDITYVNLSNFFYQKVSPSTSRETSIQFEMHSKDGLTAWFKVVQDGEMIEINRNGNIRNGNYEDFLQENALLFGSVLNLDNLDLANAHFFFQRKKEDGSMHLKYEIDTNALYDSYIKPFHNNQGQSININRQGLSPTISGTIAVDSDGYLKLHHITLDFQNSDKAKGSIQLRLEYPSPKQPVHLRKL